MREGKSPWSLICPFIHTKSHLRFYKLWNYYYYSCTRILQFSTKWSHISHFCRSYNSYLRSKKISTYTNQFRMRTYMYTHSRYKKFLVLLTTITRWRFEFTLNVYDWLLWEEIHIQYIKSWHHFLLYLISYRLWWCRLHI